MPTNSLISLTPDSQQRANAVNVIKYTLLLDYNVPELKNPDAFMDSLMDACQRCCCGLFSETDSISYGFFGTPLEFEKNPLAYLDRFPVHSNGAFPEIGFHNMILHHCVLSSYHAVLTDLLAGLDITAYELKNKLKKDGLYALYQKKGIFLDNRAVQFKCKNEGDVHNASSTASDFSRVSDNHSRSLPYLKGIIMASEKRYRLQFAPLWKRICEIPAPKFKVLGNGSKSWSQNAIQSLVDLTGLMEPFSDEKMELPLVAEPESANGIRAFRHTNDYRRAKKIHVQLPKGMQSDPVDALYYYYLVERLFNFRLFFGLLKNLLRVEARTGHRLCQEGMIEILCECRKLPNIFSRQYYIKYAFDSICAGLDSYGDFWHSQELPNAFRLFSSTVGTKKGFQFAMWQEQFPLFIDYMAHFVIPVYEWCFLNMLLESVEAQHKDESHAFHLIEAMKLLAGYMESHYYEILRPLTLPNDMDMVDIITRYINTEELMNLPKDSCLQIKKTLLCANEFDLNLPPLGPELFKPERKKDSYRGLIRKFYNNLIGLDI